MSITQKVATCTNNIKASFTNKQISTNVTYTYVQAFKDIVGFRRLPDHVVYQADQAFQRIIEHIQQALSQFRYNLALAESKFTSPVSKHGAMRGTYIYGGAWRKPCMKVYFMQKGH